MANLSHGQAQYEALKAWAVAWRENAPGAKQRRAVFGVPSSGSCQLSSSFGWGRRSVDYVLHVLVMQILTVFVDAF